VWEFGHRLGYLRQGIRAARRQRQSYTGDELLVTIANERNQVEHPLGWVQCRGKAMKVLAATLALLVSTAAAAQECPKCSSADACMATYVKSTSEAQKATKTAVRDWKQNLDKKASGEFFSRGTAALQNALDSQVRSELDRLKECLAKIK
jgi:hypothetical protein